MRRLRPIINPHCDLCLDQANQALYVRTPSGRMVVARLCNMHANKPQVVAHDGQEEIKKV